MSLQLLVLNGPDKGTTFALLPGPDRVLGRSDTATYRLAEPQISRNHCQLLLDGDQITVLDSNSRNGTFVNGVRVQRQALNPGDVLKVADIELRLERVAPSVPRPAPAPPLARPTPVAVEQLKALSGSQLAHYDIGPVIGEGQSGIVFHATDTTDQRPVALKVLRPSFSEDAGEVQRFLRSAKAVQPLRHPNPVTTYAADQTGPHCWVAMEYIAGENLGQVIGRLGVAGMLDWHHAFQVAVHIARALGYAHGQHIVHRNVTPKNILLEAPTRLAKLADLMLVKAQEEASPQVTRPGELLGEIAYLAPERTQMGGALADARADLYGLGATVYALLTGRPPFEGGSVARTVAKIRNSAPERPSVYQPSIPPPFEALILKLLAKRPEERPQTAEELLHDLERLSALQGVSA
jgi:serine/threonine-protein kinase